MKWLWSLKVWRCVILHTCLIFLYCLCLWVDMQQHFAIQNPNSSIFFKMPYSKQIGRLLDFQSKLLFSFPSIYYSNPEAFPFSISSFASSLFLFEKKKSACVFFAIQATCRTSIFNVSPLFQILLCLPVCGHVIIFFVTFGF